MKYSVIIPYYEAPLMLQTHMDHLRIKGVPNNVEYIFVDDGSRKHPINEKLPYARVIQIKQDMAWNVGGARNVGAYVAEGDWLLFSAMDRIIPREVFNFDPDPDCYYQFEDWMWWGSKRGGNKPRIAPGIDLVRKDKYDMTDGHDENLTGKYGGTDREIRRRMRGVGLREEIHPNPIICFNHLEALDGAVSPWMRDRTEGDPQTTDTGILRFDWKEL